MTISSHLESETRSALTLRLQRSRVGPNPAYDDEMVSRVLKAAGAPDGMIVADGAGAAALASLKERASALEVLTAEMLASFTRGTNGWNARVKADQVEQWRDRLGEQP